MCHVCIDVVNIQIHTYTHGMYVCMYVYNIYAVDWWITTDWVFYYIFFSSFMHAYIHTAMGIKLAHNFVIKAIIIFINKHNKFEEIAQHCKFVVFCANKIAPGEHESTRSTMAVEVCKS